jgi:hypothetical protein
VYVDGYAYRNSGYVWRRALLKWLQPGRWRRFLLHRRTYRASQGAVAAEQEQLWKRDLPSRDRFARELDALVARGVRLLFVFTGGFDLHYNHVGQFHDTFGHRGVVEVAYYPRFDHLLSRAADRREISERLCRWISRAFPQPAAPKPR